MRTWCRNPHGVTANVVKKCCSTVHCKHSDTSEATKRSKQPRKEWLDLAGLLPRFRRGLPLAPRKDPSAHPDGPAPADRAMPTHTVLPESVRTAFRLRCIVPSYKTRPSGTLPASPATFQTAFRTRRGIRMVHTLPHRKGSICTALNIQAARILVFITSWSASLTARKNPDLHVCGPGGRGCYLRSFRRPACISGRDVPL